MVGLGYVGLPVAVALPAGGALVGHSEVGAAVQKLEGLADQDFLGGNVILAKGDKSASGPGTGGHKGEKKGGKHGKQHKDKEEK